MSLFKYLAQPFPYAPSMKGKLAVAVLFGLFVFIFLVIFEPFNLDQFTRPRLVSIAIIYGLITMGCVAAATVLLPLAFPGVFRKRCGRLENNFSLLQPSFSL